MDAETRSLWSDYLYARHIFLWANFKSNKWTNFGKPVPILMWCAYSLESGLTEWISNYGRGGIRSPSNLCWAVYLYRKHVLLRSRKTSSLTPYLSHREQLSCCDNLFNLYWITSKKSDTAIPQLICLAYSSTKTTLNSFWYFRPYMSRARQRASNQSHDPNGSILACNPLHHSTERKL